MCFEVFMQEVLIELLSIDKQISAPDAEINLPIAGCFNTHQHIEV
jgi:hypothetical protein